MNTPQDIEINVFENNCLSIFITFTVQKIRVLYT